MAKMTVKGRQYFYARVANTMLNEAGQAIFFRDFYWRLDPGGNITLSIFERAEKQLAEMIQNEDYRKQ